MLVLLIGPVILAVSILAVIVGLSVFQTRNWKDIGDKLNE